jgi:type I restriction enzyme M protein
VGDWKLRNPLNAPAMGLRRPRPFRATAFRWSVWAKGLSGEALVRFLRDEVFPFFAEWRGKPPINFMDGARLVIDEPTVLTQVVTLVDGLRLDEPPMPTPRATCSSMCCGRSRQAGELGQFRTPRHIIRAIVEMLDPKIGETIYDPAAGTAGFLVAAYNHIRLANSTPERRSDRRAGRQEAQRRGLGDKLSAAKSARVQEPPSSATTSTRRWCAWPP